MHSRAARWLPDERHVDAMRHAIAGEEWRFVVDLAGERWLDACWRAAAPLSVRAVAAAGGVIEREPAIAVALAGMNLELGGVARARDAFLDLARAAIARGPAAGCQGCCGRQAAARTVARRSGLADTPP